MKYLHYLVLSAVIFSFMFSGCVNIKRELTINADGSGNGIVMYDITKDFFVTLADMLTTFTPEKSKTEMLDSLYKDTAIIDEMKGSLSSTQGLNVKEVSTFFTSDSARRINIVYDYMDSTALNAFDRADSITSMSFDQSTSNPVFISTFRTDKDRQIPAMLMPLFKDKFYTFKVTLPYDIDSSNAATTDGRTLTWQIPMEDFILNKSISHVLRAYMHK